MIPQPVWHPSYERAVAHLEAGTIGEALEALDEAVSLSSLVLHPLRQRSDVLKTLADVESACERTVDRVRGTAEDTDARLFAVLTRLPDTFQATTLSLDPRPSMSTGGRSTLSRATELVRIAFAPLISKRNLVDYLPPEILTTIGRLAAMDTDGSDVAFALSAVSQRWRAVFTQDAQMWGHVDLDGLTQVAAVTKAQTCLSRGPILRLVVDYPPMQPMDELLVVLQGRLGRLRSFVVRSPEISLQTAMQLVEGSPDCERMVIHLSGVHIDKVAVLMSFQLPILSSVRQLEIRQQPDGSSGPEYVEVYPVSKVIQTHFPRLETLVLDHSDLTLHTEHASTFNLPKLKHLTIASDPYVPHPGTTFVLPRLCALDVSKSGRWSYIPYLFPAGRPPNTKYLTHLHISRINLLDAVSHFSHLEALVRLDLRSCNRQIGIVNVLCQAEPMLCPRLEELDITNGTETMREETRELIGVRAVAKTGTRGRLRVRTWEEKADVLRWEERWCPLEREPTTYAYDRETGEESRLA